MKAAVRLDWGRFAQNDVEPFCFTVDSSANPFFFAMALQRETKLLAKSVLSQYVKYSNLHGGPRLLSLALQLPLKCQKSLSRRRLGCLDGSYTGLSLWITELVSHS